LSIGRLHLQPTLCTAQAAATIVLANTLLWHGQSFRPATSEPMPQYELPFKPDCWNHTVDIIFY